MLLVERMRRDLQETRHWYTPAEYKEGLALAQLAPGPLAAQLAIYLGWVRGGLRGATVVGAGFIGPSFVMVMALSAVYLRYGGLRWIQGAFYGIGATVIAVIAYSAFRLVKRTVGADRMLWAIVILNAALTAWTERELIWVIVASGLFVLTLRELTHARAMTAKAVIFPSWMITGLYGPATMKTVASITAYFAKAGAVVFGSGLAIVPFLHGGVVQEMHWLNERQFLDAVAVSMITPGPVVITVAFIGYLVAGPLGGIAAGIGVFLPVYLIVVVIARWFHLFAKNRPLRAMIDGVTAAATGAIAGAVIVLGRRALTDVATVTIFLVAMALILWAKKIPEPILILAAGVVGIIIHGVVT